MSDLVEIDGGLLTPQALAAHAGPYAREEHLGQLRFFVILRTDDDGRRWCLWDGSSYDDAIVLAERVRRKFAVGAPVIDLVAGGAT